MTIEKMTEFASETDAKNTDDLILKKGFPSKQKPARQWFNWLFNSLTVKVNEVIDALGTTTQSLATLKKDLGDAIDKKLDATANATSATKLKDARKISLQGAVSGSANFDGTGDINIQTTGGIGVNQTWQDLTNSRLPSTAYRNTTGSPKQIAITLAQATGYYVAISQDGSAWTVIQNGDGEAGIGCYAIIPPNYYYQANAFVRWMELI